MNTTTQQSKFAGRVANVPPSFLREILKVASNPEVVSFAGGLPNPSFFPVEALQICTQKVFDTYGMQVLQYAATEGYYPLRRFIANRYLQRFGLNIKPEQILITNGSQQALDLISKLFIDKGDSVLVERPSYLGALQCFSMYQPRFCEVTLYEDGIDVDELKQQVSANQIKLFYNIPNFQNPTGAQYSQEKRKQVAEIISNHATYIVEDDPYGDIAFNNERHAPIYSYLPHQTILLGTFSKTVAPGLRVGWMVADEDIIKKATIMKQASDLHSINLAQYILHHFLTDYNLDTHIKTITTAYEKQKNVMMKCLEQYFPQSINYTPSKGGMFTWLTLPDHIPARELLQKAMAQNILFVPGDTFYASSPSQHTLRLNFSNVEEDRMRRAMRTLGELVSGA